MSDARVRVVILGDASSAQRATAAVEKSLAGLDSKSQQLGQKLVGFGQSMVGVGQKMSIGLTLPLLAVGKRAVETSADFTRTMNTMRAVAGVPAPALEKLRKLAIDLGNKTVFSANEAGLAMLELSKAGIKTSDIMGGALSNTLDLATAGELELADAARIAANAMKVFNLNGGQSKQAADALAGAANASSADISDLAMALAQGGLAASRAGLSIQETTATLAAFADAGLRGSDAGTSLKTFLLNLVPTSKKAKETMEELNVELVDQNGNIKNITAIADELRNKLGGLTQAQQQAALKTMFGTDAYRAASVVMEQGSAGLAKYIKKTSESGAAAKVAEEKMKGLPGAIEKMKGAIDTFLLTVGDRMAPTVEQAAGIISDLLERFQDLPVPIQENVVKIAALAAAAGPLLFVLGHLTKGFGHLLNAVTSLRTPAGQMRLGFVALAVAVSGFFTSTERATQAAGQLIDKLQPDTVSGFKGEIEHITAASSHLTTKISDGFKAIFTGAPTATQKFNALRDEVDRLRDSLTNELTATNQIKAAKAQLAEKVLNLQDAIVRYGRDSAEVTVAMKEQEGAERRLQRAMESADVAVAELAMSTESLAGTRKRLAGITDNVRTAELDLRDAQRRLADAQRELNRLKEDGVTKGRRYEEALDNLKRSKIGVREATRGLNESIKNLKDNVEAAANKGRFSENAFLKLADAYGITRKQAREFIDNESRGHDVLQRTAERLGLSEDKTRILTKALMALRTGARQGVGDTKAEVDKLPGIIQRLTGPVQGQARGVGTAIGTGMVSGINSMIDTVASAAYRIAARGTAAAKSALKIKSPSRVFFDIGMNVGKGLVLGMDASASAVEFSAKRLADKATRTVLSKLGDWSRDLGRAQNQIAGVLGKLSSSIDRRVEEIKRNLEKALEKDGANTDALKRNAKRQIKALRELEQQHTKTGNALAREGERLSNRLAKLDEQVRDFRDSIKQGFSSFGDLTQQFTGSSDTDPTPAAIREWLQDQLTKARAFGDSLQQLARKGLNQSLLKQIAAAGLQAAPLVQALLDGGSDLIDFAGKVTNEIKSLTENVSEELERRFFKDDMDAAKAALVDFNKEVERFGKALHADAMKLEVDGVIEALGRLKQALNELPEKAPVSTDRDRPRRDASRQSDSRPREVNLNIHNPTFRPGWEPQDIVSALRRTEILNPYR